MDGRPNAVITGVSRSVGIAAAVARALGAAGWDLRLTGWRPYDATMPWGSVDSEVTDLIDELAAVGARADFVEADLSRPEVPQEIVNDGTSAFGPITALVVVHTHDPGGGLMDMTATEFDRHMAINARATLLLGSECVAKIPGEAVCQSAGTR